MKRRALLLSLTLALGLTWGLLWLLDGATQVAHADTVTRYVTTGGVDSGDCDSGNPCRTIQYAIGVATPTNEIWVAEGTYTDTAGTVATITETITLLGGWNDAFSVRDPDTYTTTLDARGLGRVVEITGYISPTIDGFTITGGSAYGEAYRDDDGGGILSYNASPIIQNNVIVSNVASISTTSGTGGGVALFYASATAVISGNQVVSNTATGQFGYGGGLYVQDSDATVRGNVIMSNTSSYYGGGMSVLGGSPYLFDNEIKFNISARNGGGMSLAYSSARVEKNLILGNLVGWVGIDWHGSAIWWEDYGSPAIIANRIYSNSGATAALALDTGNYYTVTNNFIAHNQGGGIKLWESTRYGLIANNALAFNTGNDGGINIKYSHITPTVVNNVVVSNSYGIRAHADASGILDYNDVWGNTTDYDLPGALEPGPHDIQADPLFVDPGDLDFHIPADSPAVNAGTFSGAPDADYDGDTRPYDCFVDIGADENTDSDICISVHLPLATKRY